MSTLPEPDSLYVSPSLLLPTPQYLPAPSSPLDGSPLIFHPPCEPSPTLGSGGRVPSFIALSRAAIESSPSLLVFLVPISGPLNVPAPCLSASADDAPP